MAELLIRIVDRGGVDLPKGYGDSKAGDVVSICPDGWAWSTRELTSENWRIVRVGLTEAECAALLALGDGDPKTQPLWKRKFGLSFDDLPVNIKNNLLKKRTPGVIDLTSMVAEVRIATILKLPRT